MALGFRLNTFGRVIVILLLITVPIGIQYSASHRVSVDVVREELRDSGMQRLSGLKSRLDASLEQLSMNAIMLGRDPTIREFQYLYSLPGLLDPSKTKNAIVEKLVLQSTFTRWPNTFSVFAPAVEEGLSSGMTPKYDKDYLAKNVSREWAYRPPDRQNGVGRFYWYSVDPITAYDRLEEAKLIVEASFPESNFKDKLDEYKKEGESDPFLYHEGLPAIANRTADAELTVRVADALSARSLQGKGSAEIATEGGRYLVYSIPTGMHGWYLIDYVPLHDIFKPIEKSRNRFYLSIAALSILAVVAAFVLYRNIQVPIKALHKGVRRFKKGDYAVRIAEPANSEFVFLVQGFNEMAEEIQSLIETVYDEKLRAREATLKQLQSQIGPHFLYNCLYFIKNMAQIGDDKAVASMCVNLGKFFRYATRTEKMTAELSEEVELVRSYLTIQALRMNKIDFRIEVPDAMLKLEVPRFLLQPVVENAVVHGLEPLNRDGTITVRGSETEEGFRLVIEDDGAGIAPDRLLQLNRALLMPLVEETGCGMWNVNQRMTHFFGDGAGLTLESSPKGGVKAVMSWTKRREPQRRERLASNSDRG